MGGLRLMTSGGSRIQTARPERHWSSLGAPAEYLLAGTILGAVVAGIVTTVFISIGLVTGIESLLVSTLSAKSLWLTVVLADAVVIVACAAGVLLAGAREIELRDTTLTVHGFVRTHSFNIRDILRPVKRNGLWRVATFYHRVSGGGIQVTTVTLRQADSIEQLAEYPTLDVFKGYRRSEKGQRID